MRILLILALCLGSAWTQENAVDLTILHFNDFHARLLETQGQGGAAYLATAIKRERANCPRCLLLSAGDQVQGSPVSTIYRGLPVFEVLRPLNVDAYVLGNHEFDYGFERINDFMAAAGAPVLAANFLTAEGSVFTEQKSIVIERDGLRIGIVGALMQDLVPSLAAPSKVGTNRLLPTLDVLRSEAARLKDKTDILIALVHLWANDCDRIVKELPEYAVTVSGHEHGGLAQMFRSGDRVGVRVRSYGTQLGRLDLRYDKSTRKILNAEWKKIPVSSASYEADPIVAQAVDRWESKVKAVVDVPVGTSKAKKDKAETKAWLERVMRDSTGAQFVFMNSGGVRDIIPEGLLLARSLWNIMPFDNMLVKGEVPGKFIPGSLSGGMTLEPEKLYTLATIDFVVETWKAGADAGLKALGQRMPLEGPLFRDVMIDWVKRKQIVD